jgi:hypothetical protein
VADSGAGTAGRDPDVRPRLAHRAGADRTYGFTIGGAPRTREQLIAEATAFVEGFSEPGGIGEDFAGFVPARFRGEG